MYKTDYIVKYHDIEEELLKRLEIRLATEAAAKITAAIESIFKNSSEHSNENIIINVEIGGNSNDGSGMHRIEILNSNKLKNTAEANTPTPTSDENVVISNNTEQQQYEEQEQEEEQSQEEGQQEEGQQGQEGQEEDEEEEYKYTREDVTYICEKLYRDELLSVFGAETLDDPEMDNGIKAIFEALINNDEFKQLLVDLNAVLLDPSKAKNETELANLKRNTDYLIFITLFSQQSFYLTHKCLCQMLTQGKVQPEMMDQLKQRTLKLFALA